MYHAISQDGKCVGVSKIIEVSISYPSKAFYRQELTEGYRLVHCVVWPLLFWMDSYSQYMFCVEEWFNLTRYENLHFARVSAVSFLIH